jgi:ADP-heptose:LPS heptosyltransferase
MGAGILYAGPWYGEFGWELCGWNPAVRRVAEAYDRVIVVSHAASEYLYEFADEFVPLEADGWSMYEGRLRKPPPPPPPADKHLRPKDIFCAGGARLNEQFARSWRRLAPPGPVHMADVLCAFRPPKQHISKQQANALKSYPAPMCEELVGLLLSHGLSVACYGGPDNWCFPGAADMRGSPLADQCSALAAAKCAVGPSSGTMHLASLCGCPHVTWYGANTHPNLRRRYELEWNPFGTRALFLPGRPPPPREVAAAAALTAATHGNK